jgi:hypothetical protein
MNTALEYSTRVVQEGGRRCKKSTLNDLVHLTPLRMPLMNPPIVNSVINYPPPLQRSGEDLLLVGHICIGLLISKTRKTESMENGGGEVLRSQFGRLATGENA